LEPPLGSVPEAGWVLDPAVHGRGYASEVLTTALAWADAHFAKPRTVCLIHPENQASLRLAHKFGYREFARSSYQNEPIVQLARERAG
jgi:RimJ/RimL family protein N-acetyltransferase